MKTNSNWKKRGFEDYDYRPHKKNQIKYNKYKLKKYHKNNQLIENNIKDLKNDENQEIQHPINLIKLKIQLLFIQKIIKKKNLNIQKIIQLMFLITMILHLIIIKIFFLPKIQIFTIIRKKMKMKLIH